MTATAHRQSQATRILSIASDLELFHSSTDEFAFINVNGHKEIWSLNSPAMTQYLMGLYYRQFADVPTRQSTEAALAALKGRARFDGDEADVFVRVAELNGNIYVDLCNPDWQVVEITPNGWSVLDESPVCFMRPVRAAALPVPLPGGDINDLRNYLNITWDGFYNALSWVVGSYMPSGPYPILLVNGEQGSSKSTTCRILKALVDPSTPLRGGTGIGLGSPPKDAADFIVTAKYSWVYSVDNVSHIPSWLSDALCRLTTGGGVVQRKLYSNFDEVTLDATRPVLINGIGDPATRSDFLDRTVLLTCPGFGPDRERLPESEFYSKWEDAYPFQLGAVFSATSAAMRNISAIPTNNLPRMADFARWMAAASSFWGMTPKSALENYSANRQEVHEIALESSVLAIELLRFIQNVGEWSGTPAELLDRLELAAGRDAIRKQGWPVNGQALSNTITRLSPNLKAFGVEVTKGRVGSAKMGTMRRVINIKMTEPVEVVWQRLHQAVSCKPSDAVRD